jgi:proline iminopeptidase
MADLYPAIEPYDSGRLDVGDGQLVYWQVSGNPDGRPAVSLHGGPGGESNPRHRQFFDPRRYRIVQFDQRGCGRSTPHVSEPGADLASNTTWHLVADIERLREHLGIDSWLVLGGSWGSALGLAYAETHSERVTELVVTGVFTARSKERQWLYGGGAAFLFPEAWQIFVNAVPAGRRGGDLVAAYRDLLDDPDPTVHGPAASAWLTWDMATMSVPLTPDLLTALRDPPVGLAFARLCAHYFGNGAWLADDQLLRDASALTDIPGVIVQGRLDFSTPMTTAWELKQAWPRAELVVIEEAGHVPTLPSHLAALVAATDRFAGATR